MHSFTKSICCSNTPVMKFELYEGSGPTLDMLPHWVAAQAPLKIDLTYAIVPLSHGLAPFFIIILLLIPSPLYVCLIIFFSKLSVKGHEIIKDMH